ncbi:MAG TPA: TIGR01777 family oxidoreductase [Chitinophagaceae bacterium]|jgi:hypothetical protein
MATVLITGGTGLIGRALSAMLIEKGYSVIVLTRKLQDERRAAVAGVLYAEWNVRKGTIDADAVQKADYIVHLAGAGVADKRWSERRQQEIVESRTKSSALIVKALKENVNKVQAVISSSATGWYGADPVIPNPAPFTESQPAATDFLGDTCRQWEESIDPVTQSGKRLVKLRTGIVLSNEGGALREFRKPLLFGIAAILGSGRQVLSWVHIDDLCRMYLKAVEDKQMKGVYNAVGPRPVDNKTLTLELAKTVRKRFFIPLHVPSFVLKIMLGEMSIEVLKSTTVSADKIRMAGFDYIYPTIEAAMNALNPAPCPPKGGT